MTREDIMHYVIIGLILYLIYMNIGVNLGKIFSSPVVKEHFSMSPATITQLNANKPLDEESRPLYR
jgi:hypothetical protein